MTGRLFIARLPVLRGLALDWLFVAIYGAIVIAMGSAMLFGSHLVGPRRPSPGKLDTYECGVPLQSETRERFSVRFYLVAILFILFDIETVFLLPWAVLHRELGVAGLAEVGIFVAVLGLGLGYLYRRGGLEWD